MTRFGACAVKIVAPWSSVYYIIPKKKNYILVTKQKNIILTHQENDSLQSKAQGCPVCIYSIEHLQFQIVLWITEMKMYVRKSLLNRHTHTHAAK